MPKWVLEFPPTCWTDFFAHGTDEPTLQPRREMRSEPFFSITQHMFAKTNQLIRSPRQAEMQGKGEQLTEHEKRDRNRSSSAQNTHTRTFLENSVSEMAAYWLRFWRVRDVFSRKRTRPILQRTRREGQLRNPRMRFAAIADTRKGRALSV